MFFGRVPHTSTYRTDGIKPMVISNVHAAFPFTREIIATATPSIGGFPPLLGTD